MTDDVLLVIATFADEESARRICREVVTEHLAACANVLPAIHSIYRWQDKVEEAAETMVFFKTTAARLSELQAKVKSLHSYDVPEIVAVKVAAVLPDYLQWVAASCA